MNDLELLAPLGNVDPPEEDTLREVAAVFAAEADKEATRPPRRGRPVLFAGGALAAAAAIVAVVTLVDSLTEEPSATDERDLVLTAFDTSTAIVHEHTVLTSAGDVPMTTDEWFSTLHPAPGQRVTHRGVVVSGRKLNQDFTDTFVWPSPGASPANCPGGGQAVLGVDLVQVDADMVLVDNVAKDFSTATGSCESTGGSSAEEMRQGIASGQWQRVPGTTTIDGRQAIELTRIDGPNHWRLWADPDSHLPIREELTGVHNSIATDYEFLADTPENTKQLHTSVPPGYRQVPMSEQH